MNFSPKDARERILEVAREHKQNARGPIFVSSIATNSIPKEVKAQTLTPTHDPKGAWRKVNVPILEDAAWYLARKGTLRPVGTAGGELGYELTDPESQQD